MQKWQQLQQKGQVLSKRVLDRHVRLGITGLSGAGKTAFITSVVAQLTAPKHAMQLPFFSPCQEERFLGGQVAAEQVLQWPRFPFESNAQQLAKGQWPASTASWSQLSLDLRYRSANPLLAKLTQFRDLKLDIVDYPGEWLLDLPMLQQDYQQWCCFNWQLFQQPHRAALAKEFEQVLLQLDLEDDSELQLQRLTEQFKTLLYRWRQEHHAYLLQPGRLLQPADLAGTPVLQLLPLLPSQLQQPSKLLARLQKHYASYQSLVIKPFYQRYFATIDRQVVLVDCLSALNAGYDVLQELQQALMLILQSFQYGPERFWQRLFQPRISKVLFAASKADQLTPEQHQNLTLLLQQLLQQPLQQSQYQDCESKAMALAAVVCSDVGQVQTADGVERCIQGRRRSDGELVTLFPGDVPWTMPSPLLFQQHAFAFADFLPKVLAPQQVIPHFRLDVALDFLLGDKLQ